MKHGGIAGYVSFKEEKGIYYAYAILGYMLAPASKFQVHPSGKVTFLELTDKMPWAEKSQTHLFPKDIVESFYKYLNDCGYKQYHDELVDKDGVRMIERTIVDCHP